MEASFVRERITQLRMAKGVSEYKMSYDLGHSRGYINRIRGNTQFCCFFRNNPIFFISILNQFPPACR